MFAINHHLVATFDELPDRVATIFPKDVVAQYEPLIAMTDFRSTREVPVTI